MGIKRYCIALILLLVCVEFAPLQKSRAAEVINSRPKSNIISVDTLQNGIRVNRRQEDIEVHFRFDKYNLDLDYMGNRATLQAFADKIDSIGVERIDSIVIISQSSPEGVHEYNLRLSTNRLTPCASICLKLSHNCKIV